MSSNPYEESVPHEDADEEKDTVTQGRGPGPGGLFSAGTDLRVQVRKNEYVVTSKAVEDSDAKVRSDPKNLFDDGSGGEKEGGR